MNLGNGRERNIGLQPAKKRSDKTRGMLGRHEIGRANEDERHPKCDWQPGLEQIGEAQGGILMWRGCLTNLASRVNLAAGNAF